MLAFACLASGWTFACSGEIEGENGGDPVNDPGADTGGTGGDSAIDAPSNDPCASREDGDWCGALLGADAAKLYHCKGKVTVGSETCKEGCFDRPGPANDVCGSDAVDPCFNDADGDYCGGAIGGDASTLYHCKDKRTDSTTKCPDGCWISPPPSGGDACVSDAVEPCWNDADGAYCGETIGGKSGKLYHCKDKKTESIEDCPDGCQDNPTGTADICGGALLCSHVQWWNSAITYGPYMSYGWWDTDLAVSTKTPVQLRHASRLDKHGVYGWGFMPEFTDQVTGKRFRFLHLQPANQYANVDGKIYPAGFIVGLSGGDTAETGLGPYSTGAHLCVQTLEAYRTCFPTGKDACK